MNQLRLWGPSAALAVATTSLLVALDRTSHGETQTVDCEDSPTEAPTSEDAQVSLFDRLTWGSGQEPVIYG
jgi:hypothetical protein